MVIEYRLGVASAGATRHLPVYVLKKVIEGNETC